MSYDPNHDPLGRPPADLADPPDPLDPPAAAAIESAGALPLDRPAWPAASARAAPLAFLRRFNWRKVGLFIVSLYLFILAISLMKEGAKGLSPLVRDFLRVDSAANSLGFGWLFAYTVMSGSPVAAAALTFFNAGVIDQVGAFAMISGSRLGASFIVLLVGFIYVLRGRDRATSLGMGLLSLTVTGSVYLFALPLGILALEFGWLDGFQLAAGSTLTSITDALFDPVVNGVSGFLSTWLLFLAGLGVILVSFNLFDKCLPELALKESQYGRVSRVVYRPVVMFGLGAAITLISMSVSVSLSILVPLSQRGFVRRENVIPYIMGAGITTFVDTLLAAVLLNNPLAFTVVLVEMTSVAFVSLIFLVFFFDLYERLMLRFVGWVAQRNRNLALYVVIIFVTPIILLLL